MPPLVLAGTAAAGVTVGWIAALNLGGQGEAWRPDFVASAQMRRALDVAPSGSSVDIALSDGKRWMLRPTLSFRAKDGGYCRQYELSEGASHGLAGLYCKGSDGMWRGRFQIAAPVQPRAGKLTPAAGPGSEALEAAVDKLIDGEALNRQEEDLAIAAKWRRK